MYVLVVDTSSTVASCAIVSEEKILGEYLINNALTHSEKMMPMIKEMVENSGIALEAIDYYAVVTGPGSFTGLRIGVATAKALAHTFNKSTVEISSMEMLAEGHSLFEGRVVPMMDARRARVFTAIFKSEAGQIIRQMPDDVLELEVLLEQLEAGSDELLFTGDGAKLYEAQIKERLGKRARLAPAISCLGRASWAGAVALKKIARGEYLTYSEIKPDYLRKSQAEREYDERHSN